MIRVLFFGAVADRVGMREMRLEGAGTVAEVIWQAGCEGVAPLIVAVNQTIVEDFDHPVRDGDEVALMPPFSGG